MSMFLLLATIAPMGQIGGITRQLLLLPLCLSIAVVYKTTRCENDRDIPMATLALWLTIVFGMYAVAVALWLVFSLFV